MTTPRADGYTYLADYRPPAWRIVHAELQFELAADATEVGAELQLQPDPAQPGVELQLQGEELELLELAVDGRVLGEGEYRYAEGCLRLPGVDRDCRLRSRVRIHPAGNTRLEGLYRSGQLLLTQCEAEGFRRITFFIDRPDVMPTWRVALRADKSRYPVLLGNGNPVAQRDLPGGRHEAVWHNPFATPAYLFAIAAGRLDHVSRRLQTASGETVQLAIWAEPDDVGRCHWALDSLERALRWDETRFGRICDVAHYNVVAAQDFTMGAMENKGLNIFNARYILADADTASDSDFLGVESVIAHEYLHNWSGNRVTLRDWFQLSLKEGLTVFRDQEFSSDLHSRPLQRIEMVRLLRSRQFAEDAGPLAHAVRPARYREINNFYTLTIYEKGAEIIRMLHALLGEQAFRAGLDKYFSDNDGRAATVEDLLAALGAAGGRDLTPFLAWYAQAGTPQLRVLECFSAESGEYSLRIEQRTPSTPGENAKAPLPIPLRVHLYDGAGQLLAATPEGDAEVLDAHTVLLSAGVHALSWRGLPERPTPAFNANFAAPVKLQFHYSEAQLALLARCERDPFNRWQNIQRVCEGVLLGQWPDAVADSLSGALADLLADETADAAFVAECWQAPDVDTLAEYGDDVDPPALAQARERWLQRLANEHAVLLSQRYHALAAVAAGGSGAAAMAARRLRNTCLDLLARLDLGAELAFAQFAQGANFNDRLAALRCLLHRRAPRAEAALARFRERFADNPLVVDKWIAAVATVPQVEAVEAVRELLGSPWWSAANPNRVRALVGSFARSNPVAFHRGDGAGYALLAEQVAVLDGINPQVAARQLTALEGYQRWREPLAGLARAQLQGLQAQVRSRDVIDLLTRMLA